MIGTWPTTLLGDVCEVIAGQSPKSIYYNKDENGLPFHQGKKEFTEKYIGPATTWTEKVTRIAEKGDVLMSVRAPVGPVNFAIEQMCIGRGLAAIRPSGSIEPEFLYNYLVYFEQNIIGNVGAVFNSINKSQIASIEIPFPPLIDQKRIVAILDEAFAAIAKAKEHAVRNLANARELFESYLGRVFDQKGEGWEHRKLGDIAEFKNGLNFTKNSVGQTLPAVGVGDFQENYYVPMTELESVTIDGTLNPTYAIQKDDILTVRSNGSKHLIGRCMLVPKVNTTTSYSGFVIRMRFDTATVCPTFLLHFLKSPTTVDRLTRGGGGANINNINQAKLSVLPVSFPPSYEEQERLADVLGVISRNSERLDAIYQQKIANLEELKQSIMQKAFTGQLTSKSTAMETVG